MKLLELDPRLLKRIDDRSYRSEGITFADADGILFLCPKCIVANGGRAGTHSVLCWRPHVPQTMSPKPGRWQFQGSGIEDLTLVAGSSSVLLTGGCRAHFFVRAGEIVNC